MYRIYKMQGKTLPERDACAKVANFDEVDATTAPWLIHFDYKTASRHLAFNLFGANARGVGGSC